MKLFIAFFVSLICFVNLQKLHKCVVHFTPQVKCEEKSNFEKCFLGHIDFCKIVRVTHNNKNCPIFSCQFLNDTKTLNVSDNKPATKFDDFSSQSVIKNLTASLSNSTAIKNISIFNVSSLDVDFGLNSTKLQTPSTPFYLETSNSSFAIVRSGSTNLSTPLYLETSNSSVAIVRSESTNLTFPKAEEKTSKSSVLNRLFFDVSPWVSSNIKSNTGKNAKF